MIVLVIIIVLFLLLWVLALRCRKGHPALEQLRKFRYAHRGLHDAKNGVPENSMKAFRLAAEHGYGIELDIHLTRDGRLAVIHDESVDRTTDGRGAISFMTFDEIKKLCIYLKIPKIVGNCTDSSRGFYEKMSCECIDNRFLYYL